MKKTTIFLLSMFFAVNIIAVSVFAVGAFASEELGEVDIHGFISQGYLKSDDHKYLLADTDDGTFEFNEMGINFSTDINENLRLGMQLLSRDLGSIGNDEVDIDWAYADYRYRNWLGVRVGKIKQPGGMYNQARDIDSARTCILLPQGIYEERYREATLATKGVGFYGTLPGHLDYQFVYGVMTIASDGGQVQSLEQFFPTMKLDSIDVDPNFSGELFWNTPLEGLRVGYTYIGFDLDLNINEVLLNNLQLQAMTEAMQDIENGDPPGTSFGTMTAQFANVPDTWVGVNELAPVECTYNLFSVEYIYENFRISAEYNDTEVKFFGMEMDGEAYFVMANYRFTDWFELGLYYSAYYPDKDDRDGKDRHKLFTDWTPSLITPIPPTNSLQFKEEGYIKDYALSTRFDVNEYWTVKLELHIMDGLYGVNFSESDDPNDPDPDWTLFAAKVSYSF